MGADKNFFLNSGLCTQITLGSPTLVLPRTLSNDDANAPRNKIKHSGNQIKQELKQVGKASNFTGRAD